MCYRYEGSCSHDNICNLFFSFHSILKTLWSICASCTFCFVSFCFTWNQSHSHGSIWCLLKNINIWRAWLFCRSIRHITILLRCQYKVIGKRFAWAKSSPTFQRDRNLKQTHWVWFGLVLFCFVWPYLLLSKHIRPLSCST